MAQRGSAFSKPSFFRTSALVIAAIAALFFVDTFLAKTERSESRAEAQRFYEAGQRLMKEGLGQDAAIQFQAALSAARDNQQYQLALGQALMAVGRFADAEATLLDLLQRDGTEGAPNLAMARVLSKEGRVPEALSYYHRSIYGQWQKDALGNRVRVRFELVDLLVSRNEKVGLLAELLPLQEEAPDDAETQTKLGRLFIAAGAPVRGADLFSDVLRKKPEDPAAYAGLGEAQFASGNYRAALGYFLMALRIRPEDGSTRQRADLCRQVLDLDPTQRGLSAEEQYRRSVKLLDRVVRETRACPDAAASDRAQDMLDKANKALKQRVSLARLSAAYELNLDLADKLWKIRKTNCAAPVKDYLSLVLDRLAE